MIARAVRERTALVGILLAGVCLFSGAVFLAEVYGLIEMRFVTSFISLPATVLGVGLVRWIKQADHRLFVHRLGVGLACGIAGLAAYDISRWLIVTLLPLNFDPFAVHARFGELITEQPRTTAIAQVVGWTYHFSNGITFAMAFVLAAGKVRWWYALLYAMFLEGMMLLIYPKAFGLSRGNEAFLIVSVLGHAIYGVTVGLVNERYNRNDAAPDVRVALP